MSKEVNGINVRVTVLPSTNHILDVECVECHKDTAIMVTESQYKMLIDPNRPTIQNILADHPSGQREMFVSGVCPLCWAEIFADRDDDERRQA